MKKAIILFIFILFFGVKNISAQTDTMYVNPNVFKDSTNVFFEIIEEQSISLKVVNLLGVTVRKYLEDSIFQKGKFEFVFRKDSLPDGVYFAILNYKLGEFGARLKIDIEASVSQLNNLKFKIFPNPDQDFITILANDIQEISIMDLNGKEILREIFSQNNANISLKNIAAGIYFIKIKTNNGEGVQKIIKQ